MCESNSSNVLKVAGLSWGHMLHLFSKISLYSVLIEISSNNTNRSVEEEEAIGGGFSMSLSLFRGDIVWASLFAWHFFRSSSNDRFSIGFLVQTTCKLSLRQT